MKGLEVNNLLIVESDGDKFFIEALLSHINLNREIGTPICSIDDFKCVDGINNLEQKLKFLSTQIQKQGIERVGIIFDADEVGVTERTKLIEEKINLVFGKKREIEFQIFIMHLDDRGELEDILKEIKTEKSLYADCLTEWKACIEKTGNDVPNKIFNKFWINNYIMYDTCTSSKHRGKKDKYCIFEYALKEKKIWNFDHPLLENLKTFLRLLSNESL